MHQTTKQYILPVMFGTILSLAGFIAILTYIDPYQTQVFSHILFFITGLLLITGVMTLLGIFIRKKFFPGIFINQFEISLRQGILIALLTMGLILLELFNLLFWWIALILVLFIIAVEFFLNSK